MASLIGPVIQAVRSGARRSAHAGALASASFQDIPIAWVGVALAILAVPTGALFWHFLAGSGIKVSLFVFVPALTVTTALFAFLMATACGYLADLLGSSSSPISGIGILTIMLVAACGLTALPSGTTSDARFIGALTRRHHEHGHRAGEFDLSPRYVLTKNPQLEDGIISVAPEHRRDTIPTPASPTGSAVVQGGG